LRDPLALNFLFQYFIIVCDVLQCTMPDRQTTTINPLQLALRYRPELSLRISVKMVVIKARGYRAMRGQQQIQINT